MGREQKFYRNRDRKEAYCCLIPSNIFPLSTSYINIYFNVCEAEAEDTYLQEEIFQNKEKRSLKILQLASSFYLSK